MILLIQAKTPGRARATVCGVISLAAAAVACSEAPAADDKHEVASQAHMAERTAEPAEPTEKTYTIQFRPTVNGEDFHCDAAYADIGTANAKIQVVDFRLWVHEVELVRENGEAEALVLDESRPTRTIADHGAWQKDGVALLDFEDTTGTCVGTPETRTALVGTAPVHDDYVGLRFKVGVPEEHNHIDPTVAEYPFGIPGMSWQWKSGYRFVRIDVATEKFPIYYFHLGSSGCTGTVGAFTCAVPNVPTVELSGFDPEHAEIEADLATIYDELDVDTAGVKTNACMSGGTDNPLCPSMFGAFGLGYGAAPAPTQRFFKVREPS